jgi:hypothetical protein
MIDSHKDISHLPEPRGLFEFVRRGWKFALSLFGSVAILYITGLLQEPAIALSDLLTAEQATVTGLVGDVVKLLYLPLGMLLLELARRGILRAWKWSQEVIGYH